MSLTNSNLLLPCSILLCLISACSDIDDDATQQKITANGDWGWQNGKGCINKEDMIRIHKDNKLDIYKNGKRIGKGKITQRYPKYRNSSTGIGGQIEGAIWEYVAVYSNDVATIYGYKDNFSFSGKFEFLRLNHRSIKKEANTDWQRMKEQPRRGDKLAPCQPL